MKTLEIIATSSGFESTFGCIPIYDGKDKTACAKWLQHIKDVSSQTGYDFRSALVHRSTRDITNIIRSLPDDISHEKIIEEIMCFFFGIPSAAAAIDELG